MAYTRAQANWQNDSAGGTPINRVALNTIEAGIVNVDGRVTTIETLPGTNKGALIVSTTGGTLSRQLIGTDGQVLTADSTQTTGLKWATPTGGAVSSVAGRTGVVVLTPTDVSLGNVTNTAQVPASLLNAQGALASANSSGVPGKLDASANFGGEVLTYDGSQTLGLKWAFPAYGNVEKAGAGFTPRPILNFIGAGVTVADSGGSTTDVTIAGSPGSSNIFAVRTATTTLNGTTTIGPQTVDGITCIAGDRVFYKDSATPTFNGIYVVGATGVSWTRATDMANGASIPSGALVSVTEGGTNGGRVFQLASMTSGATSVIVGTNSFAITALNSPPGYAVLSQYSLGSSPAFLLGTEGNFFISVTGANTLIMVPDQLGGNKASVINVAIQMDSVGGKRFDFLPGSIAGDTGFTPTNVSVPAQFDLTAGYLTFIRLTWMGSANGYYGEVRYSIPPLFSAPQAPSSTVSNSQSLGWAGVNSQVLNLQVNFSRNCAVAARQWVYNALTQLCSAALRARILANNFILEVGTQTCSDGVRGGVTRGQGNEIGAGFCSDVGVLALGNVAAITQPGTQAAALGLVAHEFCHAIDAAYYGGPNGAAPGGQPNRISSSATLVALHTDCVTDAGSGNPFGVANPIEWFAELERFRRVGDNGVLDGTWTLSGGAINSLQVQIGTGTSTGTPTSRYNRFTTFMTGLGMV